MSHQPSHSTANLPPPPEQSDEGIHFGKVVAVGGFSILLFFLSAVFTLMLMRSDEKRLQPAGPLPLPAAIGQAEIDIVDQVPFDVTRVLEGYRRDKLGRLESWGWVDRKKGIVHMPIEKAMDELVAQAGKGKQK